MTHNIEIDDEVYARLQAYAIPFVDDPNSVLRRLLGVDVVNSQTDASEDSEPDRQRANHGAGRSRTSKGSDMLRHLFVAGVVRQGDVLVWRRSAGEVHRARVGPEGTLQLDDGTTHSTPSSAARHLAGYEINGWMAWRRESDNRLLDELRTIAEGGSRTQRGSGG